MKFKISLINLLLLVGYVIVGFIMLSVNNQTTAIINGFNSMYVGLGFGIVMVLVPYVTAKDGLSNLVNITGSIIILLLALIFALTDVNWLYTLAATGGIAVIYAIALVSLSFRKKE